MIRIKRQQPEMIRITIVKWTRESFFCIKQNGGTRKGVKNPENYS